VDTLLFNSEFVCCLWLLCSKFNTHTHTHNNKNTILMGTVPYCSIFWHWQGHYDL